MPSEFECASVNEFYASSFDTPPYDKIPERMREALLRYVTTGLPPGDFLRAVIRNDLRAAVGAADEENVHLLREYLWWLYNIAPSGCHGSQAAFDAWVETHAAKIA